MAEDLFALGANDVPRVKRLLDAFEAGELNTPDPGGRSQAGQFVPFEFGFNDSPIAAGTTGVISLHTTTGDTGKDVGARSLQTSNTTANTKVKVWRHMRSGELYFDRIEASTGTVDYEFGYLSTNNAECAPSGTCLVNLFTTTGIVPGSTITARNLTQDRILKNSTDSPAWADQKVNLFTHKRSGETYFQRIPSIRRFRLQGNVSGTTLVTQGNVKFTKGSTDFTVANRFQNTTGFSFSANTTRLIIADPGIYLVSLSYRASVPSTHPTFNQFTFTLTFQPEDLLLPTLVPARGSIKSVQSQPGSTGHQFPESHGHETGRIVTSTANTPFRLLYSSTSPITFFDTHLTIDGTVYK